MRSLLWVSVLSAALAGCVADAGVGVRTTYVAPPPPVAQVTVTADAGPPPDYQASVQVDDAPYVEPTAMVYVNPDVQVIEDYEYPVFFTGGLYWRNDGGVWYSSSWHDRGWVTNYNPPVVVAHIDRPEAYVHYHANVNARVGEPGYRNPHMVAVVHPAGPPPPRNYTPSRPAPAYGHGPAVTNQHPVAPSNGAMNHPVEPGRPAEAPHPTEGYNSGMHPEPAKPAGYQQSNGGMAHPGEEPKPAPGMAQNPGGANHPIEPTRPTPAQPAEAAHPSGYQQNPPARTAPTAPAKAPAPAYKAPPPPPKKKK